MARSTFIYFLFSENRKPYYVDSNGHVQEGDLAWKKPDGQPARLNFAPDGWKDTLVRYARNIKYWGLFRDYTVPMRFVKDGATILKHLMWTQGVEAKCFLGILKLDRTATTYKYDSWYFSEINFAKYKENKTSVTVEALEGGPSKFIKANEATKYTIDFVDGEFIWVLLDGMELDFSRTYTLQENQDAIDTDSYYMGLIQTAHEGETLETSFQDIFFKSSSTYPNDDWIMSTLYPRVVRIHGTVKLQYHQNITVIIRAEDNDGLTSGGTTQYSLYNAAGTTSQIVNISIDQTITLPAGHRLHIKHTMFNAVNTGLHYTILEGELQVDYVYKGQPSFIMAYYPMTLLEKIVNALTEAGYLPTSNFLTALKSWCVTSGDAIRGIDGATIKTSLEDFFKSFFSRFGIGLTVKDDKVVIEKLTTMFDTTTTILDLDDVDEADISVAEDIMFNTIKAGYAKQDYTDANGKYETNQGQQWSSPIKRINRELDMLSPYRADPFGIELLRTNFDKKTTTDSNSDNDTFLLNIGTERFFDADHGINYYKLNRPAYTSVTGIPHPATAFNLEATPKKGLLENGPLLHGLLDLLDPQALKLVSGDKNTDLATVLSGVSVVEKDDITIGGLGVQLLRPYYINIKTKVPVNFLELLKANPYGLVRFTYNDTQFNWFLFDGGFKAATLEGQTWKMISAPGNDLTKLNRL